MYLDTGAIIINATRIKEFGNAHISINKVCRLKNITEEVTSYRSFAGINDHKRLSRSSKLYSVHGTSKLYCVCSCGELFAVETQNLAFFYSKILGDGCDWKLEICFKLAIIFFTKTDEKNLVVRGAGWQVCKITVLVFLAQTSQNTCMFLDNFLR